MLDNLCLQVEGHLGIQQRCFMNQWGIEYLAIKHLWYDLCGHSCSLQSLASPMLQQCAVYYMGQRDTYQANILRL